MDASAVLPASAGRVVAVPITASTRFFNPSFSTVVSNAPEIAVAMTCRHLAQYNASPRRIVLSHPKQRVYRAALAARARWRCSICRIDVMIGATISLFNYERVYCELAM